MLTPVSGPESLNLEERIRRLADFDLAGLGGATWNRLLDGFAGCRDTVGRWEQALGVEHLSWFSTEGAGLVRELEPTARTEFRAAEERVRAGVFRKFADAVEAPQSNRTAAVLRPVIYRYGEAVVEFLTRQHSRAEAALLAANIDRDAGLETLASHPVLLAAWEARTMDLDAHQGLRRTSRQVARSRALLAHAEALKKQRHELGEDRDQLSARLATLTDHSTGAAGDGGGALEGAGRGLREQVRLLKAAIDRAEHARRRSEVQEAQVRLRLVKTLAVRAAEPKGSLLSALSEALRKDQG